MNGMDALKCDFCGGRLIMDDSREFATCEMCGIKYMKSTIQQKIQEIRGTVSVQGNVSVKQTDFVVRAGVLEEYHGEAIDIVIPNNVVHIKWGVFRDCKYIKSVVLPNNVNSIEHGAFEGCTSLTSISFSNGIKNVDGFNGCTGLKSVLIPNGAITVRGFNECTNLTSVRIPDSVTEIGERAFENCKSLVTINIPNSVTSIKTDAFKGCTSLNSIVIPDSVSWLGNNVFSSCISLSSVTLPMRFQNDFCVNGVFDNTPYQNAYLQWKTNMIREYRSNNKCQHCGGNFQGIINKVCSNCGKPKDY